MADLVEVILYVRGLEKTYPAQKQHGYAVPGVTAVSGISFEVIRGEVFGFLGSNGAGKSSTIRILTSLSKKTGGKVVVAGADIDKDPEMVRRSIGYVAQNITIDGELNALQNLTLMGRLYRVPEAQLKARIEELISVLGLTEIAPRPVMTYSGGMRRRLDIAAALVHRPRILFLDEPTVGLDPASRQALWAYIRKLNKEDGVTIFLTTQYMEEADQLCDRIAIMHRGRIVAQGSPVALKRAVGADILTLKWPDWPDRPQWISDARDTLQELPGVREVRPLPDGVKLLLTDAWKTLPDILRQLEKVGIPLGSISFTFPTLDEVFLRHTTDQPAASASPPPAARVAAVVPAPPAVRVRP